MIAYLRSRFRERSTWEGLIAVVGGAALISDDKIKWLVIVLGLLRAACADPESRKPE